MPVSAIPPRLSKTPNRTYGRGTNYCTTGLKTTPKLRQHCTQTTRHPRCSELAAARSAAANSVRHLCKIACKNRDTGGAQNWPRRFAPRPISGVGGVAFLFACNFGVISASCSTRSCNNLSLNRSADCYAFCNGVPFISDASLRATSAAFRSIWRHRIFVSCFNCCFVQSSRNCVHFGRDSSCPPTP